MFMAMEYTCFICLTRFIIFLLFLSFLKTKNKKGGGRGDLEVVTFDKFIQ